ncbi:hypothetical protein P7C70_g7476, partial [Phenoliferia sp. Uapishka_3]
MEALQEEDEVDDSPPSDGHFSGNGIESQSPTKNGGTPKKAKNRTSVGSFKSFANQLSEDQQVLFQSSRLSQQYTTSADSTDRRLTAPLPNLKCGDETSSGTTEPLIDEIACALREWGALLYSHLYRRDYEVFNYVMSNMEALHSGRRQLLGKALSIDEAEKLRKEMVLRLVLGNIKQGLDVIVRHPTFGGLVDVEVEGEIERNGWVSLAYSSTVDFVFPPSTSAPLHLASDPSSPLSSLSSPTLSLPNFTPRSVAPKATASSTSSSSVILTGAKFYHVYLNVRAFVANPCAPGESAELYFSLFNKTDARYLTEEYCLILNHQGTPARDSEARLNKMTALFRDLSQHDIQDQLFLVCRIVKNGTIRQSTSSFSPHQNQSTTSLQVSPSRLRPDSASFDSSISHTGVDFGLGTSSGMLTTSRDGRQSYRRPFGCAVLELGQFNKTSMDPSEVASLPAQESQMSIFIPANESSFATIHEDIIASRIREIEKSPRADHVAVDVRVLYGEASALVQDHPSLLENVAMTHRLGFPDVTFPGDKRNEVFLRLWGGDFSAEQRTVRGLAQLAASVGSKNIEVMVEVRMRDGAMVDRVISRGTGEPMVAQFYSTVFRGNNTPTWGELVKLEIPIEIMPQCHIFFTFRSRGSKDRASSASNGIEKPFAFAYFPLFLDNAAFVPDGSHSLVLYRYERNCATSQFYFQAPPTVEAGKSPVLSPSILKTLIPIKDTISIRSFLVSTFYTQNETLLKLLKWETSLSQDQEALKDVLTKLRFCSEVEVCKFLRDIFDALFGILISTQNQAGELDDLVFQALVTILGTVSDRRFTNFKPVLDLYIEQHFNCSTASTHFIKSLGRLLRNTSSADAGTTLRASIKVWHYAFKFIVRSREIQRAKDVGMGVTSDHLESTFKQELRALLSQVNGLMGATAPSSIIGTQALAVQHFASVIPDLAKCFDEQDLADIAIKFGDSIVATKGQISLWRLLFQSHLVHSTIFESPTGRAALVPNIGRWLKAALGKFDENLLLPKDSQATRDNARVSWVEGIRLATGTIAAMLDRIQEALVSPEIRKSRSLLGQEQDNIEYLLNLLPRLLESYRELENPANLEAVERHRSQASVVADIPVVFPSSYPFSLLSRSPAYTRNVGVSVENSTSLSNERPTLKGGVGEIAAVFIALLLLAPRKIFVGWLEAQLEIEGKENFGRHLTQMFRVSKSILENDAYPTDWLNINILAHRVILKMVDPISEILERDFIPSQKLSFTFNTGLWREFFSMLLRLLSSPQLLIEEFSPQKRRAVWRLAGDIRGEGAKVLIRLWNAIGWPEERATEPSALKGRHGGYQVQFVPGLVEDVLSLCLSHHDELRTVAVHVLYSMIVSEYYLNDDFTVIEAEVIDRLDKLFMSQTKGDEISRAFFVGQLRALFDEAEIEDQLREQVDAFLSSVNSFLDLLLAVRNLPVGEEFQEDRIISTLKLMSFIRGIGRAEIFVRYVNRLVTYHVALGNETEAGLTLKLHAELHQWNQTVEKADFFFLMRTLYMRILAHLSKGKAWETALAICKELQHEYETTSFNYQRLSELLILQSELYASIARSDRVFGFVLPPASRNVVGSPWGASFSDFYRVAFYGNRFPLSVSGKQFVYRGNEGEKLGAFVEKMLNKHPQAQLLKTSAIPSEEVYSADAQLIQITPVAGETDSESPIFSKPDVPQAVKAYYEHNATNTFSFTRPVTRHPPERVKVVNPFTLIWTEKTVLICEDAFPTVLRRSEVVEIRIIDISPVENALSDIQAKIKELDGLERRYHALAQTEAEKDRINTNVLSMALNGVVDPPFEQGVPMFRKAFFDSDYLAANPEKGPLVRRLGEAIDALVLTVSRCMKLHQALAPDAMQSFHLTLERFFEKNFSEELSRLPNEDYDIPFSTSTSSTSHLPQSSSADPLAISITSQPSIRYSTVDLPQPRRDSTATVRSSRESIASTITPLSTNGPLHKEDRKSVIVPRPELGKDEQRDPHRSPVLWDGSFTSQSNTGPSNANGNSNGKTLRTPSLSSRGPERKGSVLGGLRWKRKGSSINILILNVSNLCCYKLAFSRTSQGSQGIEVAVVYRLPTCTHAAHPGHDVTTSSYCSVRKTSIRFCDLSIDEAICRIGLMPRAMFAGVFIVVGWGSVEGIGVVHKTLYLLLDQHLTPLDHGYINLKKSSIFKYVLVQWIFLAMILAISETIAGIGFLIFITVLIPVRYYLVPRFLTAEELAVLDAPTANSDALLVSLGGPL